MASSFTWLDFSEHERRKTGTERCLALKDDTRHRKRNRDQTCLLTIQPSPF